MSRLPLEERRQVFLARQRARQAMLGRLSEPAPLSLDEPTHRRVRLVLKAVSIALLLGAGVAALQTVTFHPPTSVVEALLPRG